MADGRTELERSVWGLHRESLRQSYFAWLGNDRKSEECRLLADKWQQRRDALWAEAQGVSHG
jgi:hypothetical protein